MIKAQSIASIFDDWCKNIHPSQESIDLYGFELRVVVSKDIPPRHQIFSWIRGMGITKFDEIFSGELSRLPDDWLIAFPERHCSVDETTKLIYQLCKLNREKNLGMKKLGIITSSPYIISDTKSDCITIIGFPDGKVTYNQDYMM
jgi:hypothetical protein